MYSLVDINEHSTASRRVLISIQSIEYGDYLCERTHNRTRKKSRYRTAIENIIIHEFELIQWNLSILLAHVWLYMISVPIWIQKCTNTTVSKRFNSSHCWLLQLQIIISTNATVRNLLQLTKEFLHTSISLYSIFTFSPIFLWRDNLKCFCDRTQFRYFLEEKKIEIASISHISSFIIQFSFYPSLGFTLLKGPVIRIRLLSFKM